MKSTLPLIAVLLAGTAVAEDTRQMDAHEHGVGALNIAVDGNIVAMEFRAPGADIVGFEYEAETAEDRAAIDGAVAVLARPLDLFVLPAAAECTVTQANAELEAEDGHEDHAAHGHGHAGRAERASHHHDHDHDDHADAAEASHSEFHAEYTLTCGDSDALSEITFAYFDMFENARELEVQIVTNSGAQAFEVMREAPSLDLTGMF